MNEEVPRPTARRFERDEQAARSEIASDARRCRDNGPSESFPHSNSMAAWVF